jgi:Leucine-rich repeat (LRR) protein
MNLFLNYPEVIELDLSNNLLTKLPLEISFLTCLTKLDIRNNSFANVTNHFILIK